MLTTLAIIGLVLLLALLVAGWIAATSDFFTYMLCGAQIVDAIFAVLATIIELIARR